MNIIYAKGRVDPSIQATLLSFPVPKTEKERIDLVRNAISVCNISHVDRRLAKLHTQDPFMNKMKDQIRKLAYMPEPVLITGPTGTGKELLASACVSPSFKDTIDDRGKLYQSPFVAVNCASLNYNLVASEFFGHLKGSFTGAADTKRGLLEEAGDGVIFLDEIGELPLENQAALLRAIQENEIRPVGSTSVIKINCRFVASTKYNLEERVDNGKFRDDLYARISVYGIKTTSLQQRPADIQYIASKLGYDNPIPSEALPFIYKYNVRGLQSVIANLKLFNEWIPR